MAKRCDKRKVTFKMTRKHEHILAMTCAKNTKNTTDLLNSVVKDYMKNLINECKSLSDKSIMGYEEAVTKKTSYILSQHYGSKRVVISFRLRQDVADLISNHFLIKDEENNEIHNVNHKMYNKIVAYIVMDYLEQQNFKELCDYFNIEEDEVWHWIQKEIKAIY